jgi:hypothetical protein
MQNIVQLLINIYSSPKAVQFNKEPIFLWRGSAAPQKNWFLILRRVPIGIYLTEQFALA